MGTRPVRQVGAKPQKGAAIILPAMREGAQAEGGERLRSFKLEKIRTAVKTSGEERNHGN